MSNSSHPSFSSKPLNRLHLWDFTAFRDLLIIVLVIAILWLGYQLQTVVVPVLAGLGLAYLTDPLLDYVENNWKFPRWLAIAVMIFLLCGLVIGLVFWIGPILADQTHLLIERIPTYLSFLADRHGVQLRELIQSIDGISTSIQANPFSSIQTLLTGTGQVWYMTNLILGTIGGFLFSFMLVVIYFFFFAWNFPSVQQSLWQMVEAMGNPRWRGLLIQMDQAIGAFFRGRLLIALMMAVMFGVGWYWADVPYWIILGLGAGLISLIPYAATLSWPVAILLKYLDMSSGSVAVDNYWMQLLVWPSVVYLGVQLVEGWVLTPWIQSQSTDMSTGTILLVILIGGSVGGMLGLILAIPVTACLKIVVKEIIIPRIQEWRTVIEPPTPLSPDHDVLKSS